MTDWAVKKASAVLAECVGRNKGDNVAFYLAQALRNERERCAMVAWEYARRLREPTGISMQQGDDIAAAIRSNE